MTLAQVAVAAASDIKWLRNSSALLRRRIRYTAADSRWWGLVRLLTERLQLPLNGAARAATAALLGQTGALVRLDGDPSHSASLQVDLARYGSVFLGNLSRALVHETPKRRGRPARRSVGGPIAAARRYGIDLGLLRSALERTPAERLAMLEANAAFVRGMRKA